MPIGAPRWVLANSSARVLAVAVVIALEDDLLVPDEQQGIDPLVAGADFAIGFEQCVRVHSCLLGRAHVPVELRPLRLFAIAL